MKCIKPKRSIIVSACIIVCAVLLSGCYSYSQPKSGQSVYSAQFPYSAEMYVQFLAKEIEPITNTLITQCLLADSVIRDNYPAKDAIASAESAIEIIDDCIENVDTMQPALEYDETRIRVLELMQNAKSSVETYRDELKKRNPNIDVLKQAKDVMQADFFALTNEFNVQYK